MLLICKNPQKRVALILAVVLVISLAAWLLVRDTLFFEPDVKNLPDIIPALPANLQDLALQPRLVWLPQDDQFFCWWPQLQPVKDGCIAPGSAYDASLGQIRRVDRYDSEGKLQWTYQDPAAEAGSNYQCAALRQDGSILIGGRQNIGMEPEVGLLSAFGADGRLLWQSSLDDPADKNLGLTIVKCLESPNGRILTVAASSLYNIPINEGRQPVIIACFDAAGQQAWVRELDFSGMTDNYAAALSPDGGLYLALSGYKVTRDYQSEPYSWILAIDRDGREIWRRDLMNSRYRYQPADLVLDDAGNLLLACSAYDQREIPMPQDKSAVFHDRFTYLAYNPAALLKLDGKGKLVWTRYINGAFGASSQQVVFENQTVFWRLNVIDDILPPYIFMSIDHRSVGHDVLVTFNSAGRQQLCCQLAREDSGGQKIQRFENGQPVLIGFKPYVFPEE